MPSITLYELGPSRSARARWTLLEAGLEFESVGNSPDIVGSAELRRVHPLGKLPAAVIDGQPLFESAAISTAIADMVPEQRLIADPGSWSRALHDQWVCFALTELEAWAWTAELNTATFAFPKEEHVSGIVEQSKGLYQKSAAVLDDALSKSDYLIEERFTVTDIIVGYTVLFGEEMGWIADQPHLLSYLDRLCARPHCTLTREG